MANKTKIKTRLATSVLLDAARKEKIAMLLEKMTPEELDQLDKILTDEKDGIASTIKNFLIQKGEDGAASIEMTIIKIQKTFHTTSEKQDRQQEDQKAENLLKQI